MPRPRTPARISESLHQRLNSYALAASAAGVGMLALVQPAEAKIVYTPGHKVLRGSDPPKTLPLDLDNDGKSDFEMLDLWTVDQDFGSAGWLYLFPSHWPNGAEGYLSAGGTIIISALAAGAKIGRSKTFMSGNSSPLMCHATEYSSREGRWCNARDRYIGLRFSIKGKVHYGWARVSTTVDKHAHITATLTGYAYETIPGKSIVAGKTHGKDVITVQDASLGHLARGSSAISTWRVKEGK